MAENRLSVQLPLIISHTTKAERNCLRRFSALSVFLHAVVLAILLIWSDERLRFQAPVQVIAVDLNQVEPSRPRVLPPLAHPLPKPAPVRLPAPVPVGRPTPAPIPSAARPPPSIPAAVTPAATAVSVAATTPASEGLPAVMPLRPVVGVATVKPGPAVPVGSPEPAASVPVPHVSRTADNAGIRASYMQRCRGLIERHKEYPVMARKGMIEGTVIIRGALARDGSLRQCIINRTSGSGLLDNAAMRAVRSVDKFPPMPLELQGEELLFELPISFRLSAE